MRAPHITAQLRQAPGHGCRPAGRAPQLQPHPCLSQGPSGPAPLEQQGRGAGGLDRERSGGFEEGGRLTRGSCGATRPAREGKGGQLL